MRMAPVPMTTSPPMTSGAMPPAEPMRMKVSAPQWISSSTAMAVEGLPMPWEQAETFSPSRVQVQIV